MLQDCDDRKFFCTPLHSLKGVGNVWNARLEALGLKTFWDALSYLPRTYEWYDTNIKNMQLPGLARVLVLIQSQSQDSPYTLRCEIIMNLHQNIRLSTPLYITFFKKLTYPIQKHTCYIAEGHLECLQDRYVMKHPRLSRSTGSAQPECRAVYPLKYGLSSQMLRSIIQRIFLTYPDIPNWIPSQHKLPSQKEAFRMLHFPETPHRNIVALKRLAFDELIAHQLAIHEFKSYYMQQNSSVCVGNNEILKLVLERFGKTLTPSQQEVWDTIRKELACVSPMLRLLQGDVGSGKSIIAFLTLIHTASSGKQAGLLAPTEVLAHQHIQDLRILLQGTGISLALWTGSSKKRPRADIIVGTHALFQERVSFEDLAAIVVDEQHRFGVLQRLNFVRKGKCMPHILLMSATPIPRTLEMVLWGQISVSRLEKRPEQKVISTYVMSWKKIPELYQWIQRCLERDESVYWVCPWIDGEEDRQCGEVLKRYQDLQTHFPEQVGMLHGKLSWAEKEAVLDAFLKREIMILVATTVIEVGIHVDHASTMIIEESQRFGLAQLHQLRGRVGRGCPQGYCFLIWGEATSSLGHERLRLLRNCQDGFVIAQEDLRLRGSGSVCGLAQSGLRAYRFVDLLLHQELIDPAMVVAQNLRDRNDPCIPLLLGCFEYHNLDLWGAG